MVLLGVLAAVATLSLAQGFVDVVLPAWTGQRPFGILFSLASRYGSLFLVGWIFIHNLGLACVVPGYGFMAGWWERDPRNRRHIGLLLAGAVFGTLILSGALMLRERDRFNLAFALPIFVAEALAVSFLAVAAAREVRAYVPTGERGWSLVTPMRRLGPPLVASVLLLGFLAAVEVRTIVGA